MYVVSPLTHHQIPKEPPFPQVNSREPSGCVPGLCLNATRRLGSG